MIVFGMIKNYQEYLKIKEMLPFSFHIFDYTSKFILPQTALFSHARTHNYSNIIERK